MLVKLMTNISIYSLFLLLRLETSSWTFNDFNEMAISHGLLIYSKWRLLFLIVLVHTFNRGKRHKLIMISF